MKVSLLFFLSTKNLSNSKGLGHIVIIIAVRYTYKLTNILLAKGHIRALMIFKEKREPSKVTLICTTRVVPRLNHLSKVCASRLTTWGSEATCNKNDCSVRFLKYHRWNLDIKVWYIRLQRNTLTVTGKIYKYDDYRQDFNSFHLKICKCHLISSN